MILVTPLFSSSAWPGFCRAESGFIIASSELMSREESCGSGSAITLNMIASSANLRLLAVSSEAVVIEGQIPFDLSMTS
jgi:hypothetical protein